MLPRCSLRSSAQVCAASSPHIISFQAYCKLTHGEPSAAQCLVFIIVCTAMYSKCCFCGNPSFDAHGTEQLRGASLCRAQIFSATKTSMHWVQCCQASGYSERVGVRMTWSVRPGRLLWILLQGAAVRDLAQVQVVHVQATSVCFGSSGRVQRW
jgi:hypothetical protein